MWTPGLGVREVAGVSARAWECHDLFRDGSIEARAQDPCELDKSQDDNSD